MIDYQLEQVTSYYKSYADQYGMEYADFLEQQVGMTEEEFVKKMTETVKQSLGQEMVLRAIAETEGVEISDEKFQEKASKYAAQMGSTDVDAFISQYGKSTIMASILQDEAVEILEKNAVVKMQTVHWQRQQQKPRQKQHLNKNVCNDPVQAEALAAGLLQVFHKKDCNCEVTEHYISKISEEET